MPFRDILRFQCVASFLHSSLICATFAAMEWKYLNDIAQLDEIEQNSNIKPQIIFKHSTRCIISKMVLGDFEKKWTTQTEIADLFFLDLLQYREISDHIASHFDVRHESPQLLIIRGGRVIYHESHDSIHASEIEKFLAN